MKTTYRHVLVFASDEKEWEKAQNAHQWLKQHVHLSEMHDPSCYVDLNCSFPEVVFYTDGSLNEGLIKSILEACKPGSNGDVPPGNAEFNVQTQGEDKNPFVLNYQILSKDLINVRGHGVRVCLIQTEETGKTEAWLFAVTGETVAPKSQWKRCSRDVAILHVNIWLDVIELALRKTSDDKLEIVEL